jgi:hypothetical protein
MAQNNNDEQRRVDNSVNNGVRNYSTGYEDYEDYNEETAAEISPSVSVSRSNEDEVDNTQSGKVFGYIAIALAIISLFAAPVLFGAGAIILGFVARAKGATGLGNWSIGLGALSLIVSLFLAPFF